MADFPFSLFDHPPSNETVAVPGFGFFPKWFFDTQFNSTSLQIDEMMPGDDKVRERGEFKCEYVKSLFEGGVAVQS